MSTSSNSNESGLWSMTVGRREASLQRLEKEIARLGGRPAEIFDGLRCSKIFAAQVARFMVQSSVPFQDDVVPDFVRSGAYWGPAEWSKHFGLGFTERQLEGALNFPWPADLLKAECPLNPGKRIQETHLPLWIPSMVGYKDFSIHYMNERLGLDDDPHPCITRLTNGLFFEPDQVCVEAKSPFFWNWPSVLEPCTEGWHLVLIDPFKRGVWEEGVTSNEWYSRQEALVPNRYAVASANVTYMKMLALVLLGIRDEVDSEISRDFHEDEGSGDRVVVTCARLHPNSLSEPRLLYINTNDETEALSLERDPKHLL